MVTEEAPPAPNNGGARLVLTPPLSGDGGLLKPRSGTRPPAKGAFQSFWMGGFECSSHVNRQGERVDMIAATQHDTLADVDYSLLPTQGIRTARDAPRWHLIERTPGQYDFSSLHAQARAAQKHGVQVVWDVCHYGWPDGLDIFSGAFVDRFARFASALASYLSDFTDAPPVYVPINEIAFLAHAVGEVGFVDPQVPGRGWELQQQLVRAAIAGTDAIRAVEPRARFAAIDPLVHVMAPANRPDLADAAWERRTWQYHGWDMLCGRVCPELGGSADYLDIVGVNFYHDGQWEHEGVLLEWAQTPRDPRWMPLSERLVEVWERYRRPLFVSETSHFGVGRAPWLREVVDNVYAAQARGVPVEGICLYPIVDRPDWDNAAHWHNSGLWDVNRDADGTLRRVLNRPYAEALRAAQEVLPG